MGVSCSVFLQPFIAYEAKYHWRKITHLLWQKQLNCQFLNVTFISRFLSFTLSWYSYVYDFCTWDHKTTKNEISIIYHYWVNIKPMFESCFLIGYLSSGYVHDLLLDWIFQTLVILKWTPLRESKNSENLWVQYSPDLYDITRHRVMISEIPWEDCYK